MRYIPIGALREPTKDLGRVLVGWSRTQLDIFESQELLEHDFEHVTHEIVRRAVTRFYDDGQRVVLVVERAARSDFCHQEITFNVLYDITDHCYNSLLRIIVYVNQMNTLKKNSILDISRLFND